MTNTDKNAIQLAENRIAIKQAIEGTKRPFYITVDGLYTMQIYRHKLHFRASYDTPEVNVFIDGKNMGLFPIDEIPNICNNVLND